MKKIVEVTHEELSDEQLRRILKSPGHEIIFHAAAEDKARRNHGRHGRRDNNVPERCGQISHASHNEYSGVEIEQCFHDLKNVLLPYGFLDIKTHDTRAAKHFKKLVIPCISCNPNQVKPFT